MEDRAYSIEKYEIFELKLSGSADGNPFEDTEITGVFSGEKETVTVDGFYDGEGRYLVRFMPSFEGNYTYSITMKNGADRSEYTGSFTVTAAKPGVHGPVCVANKFHFAYADGTMYYPVGTTCYVWNHQNDALERETLETLSEGFFNKIRFCVFPKHYIYNFNEPRTYPYEGTPMDSSILNRENFNDYNGAAPGNSWNFRRFVPAHFRHLEDCIRKLDAIGVEAELILFHPYDRWGFSEMSHADDLFYLKYIVARLGAFRNVWWSFANEYDLLKKKTLADWKDLGEFVQAKDPYGHPRSIHNCVAFYDHTENWITHACLQRQDLYRTTEYTDEWREKFGKPVITDEMAYEGDIECGWGNISGQEIVRRFWEAAVRGGYGGHGETFLHHAQELPADDVTTVPLKDVLWWSHGGRLYGDSPARLRFLKGILEETPGQGLKHLRMDWDDSAAVPDLPGSADERGDHDYYLFYYGFFRPSFREFHLDDVCRYEAEVIDTWNMTIEKAGVFTGKFRVALPAREYMAIRLRKLA